MSRRIDIELTSARPDGSWTWRAAGAREPKGALDGAVLPEGAKVGDVLRAEAEMDLDGINVLSTATIKGRTGKDNLLEMISGSGPFEAVTTQLAPRGRGGGRRDHRRDDRRDDRGPRRRDDRDGRDGRGPRRDAGERGERSGRGGDDRRAPRRSFTPPPELPARPKMKRLKPGRAHRNEVLAQLDEAQRPVAERLLSGGIPAVRQAIKEQNAALRAEGQELVPEAGLISMAEQLLPRLRVAEWLDRAEAAHRSVAELDLRDLRSVVAGADDPIVARDESTRELAATLKAELITKQETELQNWFTDIDAALGVGRVVRALKLSSQPPKAGVPFPGELASRLAEAANASLEPDAQPERWVAVLEAAAFSPIRTSVQAPAQPVSVNADLVATVTRLGPLLPQIAATFGVEVRANAPAPKPLRPTRPGHGSARSERPRRDG